MVTPRTLNVKVPQGVRDGTRIRVKGEGGVGAGGRHRDIYLIVKLSPHRLYEVKGGDVYRELSITVTEAVLGARIQFPTLRGMATMALPPGTQGGQRFRLAGQGLPASGGNPAGDFYVTAQIVVPRNLSDEEKGLYERLAHLRQENPREAA